MAKIMELVGKVISDEQEYALLKIRRICVSGHADQL